MDRRSRFSAFSAIGLLLFLACSADAAQRVTLRSGTVLIGDVSMSDGSLRVTIDGGPVLVPFEDVATVTPVDTPQPDQAERLLIVALEARVLDAKAQTSGLLREAYRLAPSDPRIAFWYAHGLESAGYGKMADKVVAEHRGALLSEYAGSAEKLFKRIAERVEMERLPGDLVARIDAINAAAAGVDHLTSDRIPTHGYFRLVDQTGEPIPKKAFRVTCNGSNQELVGYSDGYHLFSYGRYRNNRQAEAQLHVAMLGYETKSFDIATGSRSVKNSGELIVKRYSEEEKRRVAIRVLGRSGDPILDAKLTVRPKSTRHSSSESLTLQTDAKGLAEARLSPGDYTVSVSARDHVSRSTTVSVSAGGSEGDRIENKVTVYRRIPIRLQVAWQREATTPGGSVTEGETVIDALANRHMHHNEVLGWLRTTQVESTASLMIHPNGGYRPGGGGWLRVKTGIEREDFDSLKLDKITELRGDWERPKPIAPSSRQSQGTQHVECRTGDCFIGELSHFDHSMGQQQMVTTRFKILALEAGPPESAD